MPANPGVDIWALGCILFRMINGYAPFDGSTKQSICSKIINNDYIFDPFIEKEVSDECIDLIHKMLIKDHKERINMCEIANHDWLKCNITDL